jgi:uncharacterized protein YdhG (YjbR/CyaY superfamily)
MIKPSKIAQKTWWEHIEKFAEATQSIRYNNPAFVANGLVIAYFDFCMVL